MDAWTWTVFQLMTQAAMSEHDEKNKNETTNFVGNLMSGNIVNFPSLMTCSNAHDLV